MAAPRIICFDLDDTLIPNSYLYNEAAWRCGLIMSRALGQHCQYWSTLVKTFDEIDKANVATMGFSRHRFALSWMQLYAKLCDQAGLPKDGDVISELQEAGSSFAKGPFNVYPGTHEALTRLRVEGHQLCLITAGDQVLQRTKIQEAGLPQHFHKINVTGVNKKEALEFIVGDQASRAIMVGDSKKSDIQPALDLGMTAVWVPSSTWDYVNAEIAGSKFHTIRSICELPALIEAIDAT